MQKDKQQFACLRQAKFLGIECETANHINAGRLILPPVIAGPVGLEGPDIRGLFWGG